MTFQPGRQQRSDYEPPLWNSPIVFILIGLIVVFFLGGCIAFIVAATSTPKAKTVSPGPTPAVTSSPIVQSPPTPGPIPTYTPGPTTFTPSSIPTFTPSPAAGTTAPTTDPRFPTCAEAKRPGYGPYSRGRPEYSWYQDQDGDGTVCEE